MNLCQCFVEVLVALAVVHKVASSFSSSHLWAFLEPCLGSPLPQDSFCISNIPTSSIRANSMALRSTKATSSSNHDVQCLYMYAVYCNVQ